jgi:hypothetical protein
VPACHPWVTDLQAKCFRAEALGGLVLADRHKS